MNLGRSNLGAAVFQCARHYRKNPTLWEAALWQRLRHKQLGVRFHRQKVIAGYIVDFWCPAWKIAVELDGAFSHDAAADAKRDAVLEQMGIRVLRFRNDVTPDAIVCDIILDHQWLEKKKTPRGVVSAARERTA